jgi:transcriptional regulator with XRE-family HTH domain
MRTRRRSTIIVVGGALAVASVGYGLGTQADDGTAVARSDQTSGQRGGNGGPPRFFGGGQPPGFADLADTLGVDADKLAQALRDFHSSQEGNSRDDHSAALADALGIPADRVSAALDRVHQKREARIVARVADALGVEAGKLQAALDKVTAGTPPPPDEFAQALADELGVDAADVRKAFFEKRPDGARRHGHRALPLRQLASELGVSRAELRKAFRELRAAEPKRFEQGFERHNQALATFLADRFSLSAADVKKALDDLPHPRGPEHCGRLGLGGPGLEAPGMYPAPQPS